MLPSARKKKARNSAKVNLMISAGFHGAIAIVLIFFAAHEGLLGKKIKKIAVEMVKEKQPEKPKEPEKPKVEPPKLDTPKVAQAPRIEAPKVAPPPTMAEAPPVAAPPAVDVPSFVFEGGKAVESTSDPVQIYKGLVEYALRSRWNRPEDMEDHSFEADVEISVDSTGQIDNPVWKKSSGNQRWDDSVRRALADTRSVDRPPPPKFPSRVVVRFDVAETEAIAQ